MLVFRQLFDLESSTYTYLLADETTREAVIIDPVLEQVDRDLAFVAELGLTLRFALDTHVHADHITGQRSDGVGAVDGSDRHRRIIGQRQRFVGAYDAPVAEPGR